MTTTAERTYTTIDKSGWGDGPWQDEPDKVQWTDVATGLPCLAVRNALFGHWCGYVGVPDGHPFYGASDDELYGIGHDDAADALFDAAHEDVNYSAPCEDDADEATAICHVPEPGAPDDVWWFGFHCGDFRDKMPALIARERVTYPEGAELLDRESEYRTLAYVQSCCARMAAALNAVAA